MAAVVAALALVVAVVASWTERTVFDADRFADRSVVLLDAAPVRHALAESIADELIARGASQLSSYRFLLVTALEDVVRTQAFRTVFRHAVVQAHRAIFQRDADRAVLELADTLAILSSSAAAGTSLVDQLPKTATSILVDVTPRLRGLDLWRDGERLRWLDDGAWALTVVAAGAAVALHRRRRVAVLELGLGVAAAGTVIVVLSAAAPGLAVARVRDPALAGALRPVVARFLGDLRTLGWWLVPLGAAVAAAASAAGAPHLVRDGGAAVGRARTAWARWPRWAHAVVAVAGFGVGVLVVDERDAVVPALVALAGAGIAYTALVELLLAILGPLPAAARHPAGAWATAADDDLGGAAERRSWRRHGLAVVLGTIVVGLLALGLVARVGSASADATKGSELRCNGFAELCDRRLDQVAFAGAHNAMSAASDPGWVFAENLTGIPSQLEYGVRALLVKSHYGIDTGVKVGSADLIVTDTDAEIANNAAAERDELPPDAVARAQQLEQTARPQGSRHDVYLCHVYCSLGATKMSAALADIRRFLDRNPDEVVMLFIGDYVSADDTAKVVEQAGLLDRLWTYDRSAPPPTLRQMIAAKRNLLVLSEHAGGTPAWYTPGYGIFQDTPYTFAAPSDFSCAANRGPSDAPLFQINHWITNKQPPNEKQALDVNAEGALLSWVQRCQRERQRFPTIIGVNFFSQGDLMKVVDAINGVSA